MFDERDWRRASMTASLCQVAFSTLDLEGKVRWYREILGFLPSGSATMGGEQLARIQGLPEAQAEVEWLCDRQRFFQLELFRFTRPVPRALPGDHRANDVGYAAVGIHVDGFDDVLARLALAGTPPLTSPLGATGSRRVCVRDPDGVLIELMEDDVREGGPERRVRPATSVVRSVTASVRSIEDARRFWVHAIGLTAGGVVTLHSPEHEALWDLAGASRDALVLWGDDIALELVQYTEPPGRAWTKGHRISDQGIVNVAVGFTSEAAWEETVARTRAAGYLHHFEAAFPGVRVVYVDDDQGFSVELLYRGPENASAGGWEPVHD